MAWELVDKDTVASNIRMPADSLQDIWYNTATGLVERFTKISIGSAANYTELGDGNGGTRFQPEVLPLNSVSSLSIHGTTIPSSRYVVRWDGVWFRSPDISYTNPYVSTYVDFNYFPLGVANVDISYNGGGTDNLPNEYSDPMPMVLILVIKELATLSRMGGSDQTLDIYRPDRSQTKEEVLQNYGIHGKVRGIIKAWLPPNILLG